MVRNKPLLFVVVLSCFALSSCNLHRKTGGGGGGGGGNATVSFTLVADTLPANPSILSFNVSISGVTLTPATGTEQTLQPSASGTQTISSFTFTVNSMGQQGIGIDFDLKNAISLSGGTVSVNFNPSSPNPAVLSAVALPRMNANLGTNQLALIEDFSGVFAL